MITTLGKMDGFLETSVRNTDWNYSHLMHELLCTRGPHCQDEQILRYLLVAQTAQVIDESVNSSASYTSFSPFQSLRNHVEKEKRGSGKGGMVKDEWCT